MAYSKPPGFPIERGKIHEFTNAIRFTSRIWPGDTLTCSGKVVRVYDENGITHVDLEITASNQKGEPLVKGEATVRPWRP